MNSGLGQMRHRISLMREEYHQGAGGRLVKTTPIIADVWASIADSTVDLVNRADTQKQNTGLTVTMRYCETSMTASHARLGGTMYRITTKQKHGFLNPSLEMQMSRTDVQKGSVS